MEHTYTVALAGNPNVGKSTVFNRLTGLRQHTGNWPGKTVERAEGYFSQAGQRFRLVDLPGTYSLAADSPEEEVAGAFLQSGQADAVIVVVDASCLRRGLILALQLRQQTQRLVLCVNLMDEAARRGVTPQTERLGQLLDVPVVDGIYRTVAWVVAVMLPPMAIFFPLFTLLEDAGYLPRVAFCMDRCFRAAGACGRQSLTMAMGFGCNACGVTGCRIIASPRERLVAILTNCFVPCNGRFPTLIALISLFFLGDAAGPGRSALAAAVFLGVIVFCVAMTLAMSKLLSATVLRGQPSFFSLELPPYRLPQVGRVLVRSLLDRTVFVLGRALTVTAPAGLLIWGMGNMDAGGVSLLERAAGVLSPLGRLMGLDGMVLLAFLLGFPANEIVLPILLMGYLHTGTLTECGGLEALRDILLHSGWTTETALCMMALCLLHFPCGTTCLTIRRETGGCRWTLLAMVLPTAVGMAVCMLIHGAFGLLG